MDNPRRRKSLILSLTEQCNLACRYCYETNKSDRKMPLLVAQNAVTKHVCQSDSFDEIEISFHGGEPLLEFETMRRLCEWVWDHEWEKPYIFFATTNGTMAHGAIQTWAAQHRTRFYLGLSLDGTRSMHNLNRSNSYESIDVEFFHRTWPDQPVKMTVSDATLPFLAEGVVHFHESNILFHCNFAHGIDWSEERNISILTEQLGELINYYLRNPEIIPCDFMMMDFDVIGASARRAGQKESARSDESAPKWCGIGTDMVAIDIDGTEYPCHFLLPNTLGSESDCYQSFNFADHRTLEDSRCRGCALLPLCPTCYGSNILARGHPSRRDAQMCTLSKIRALASSNLQAKMLLRRGEFRSFRRLDPRNLLDTIQGIETVQSGISFD